MIKNKLCIALVGASRIAHRHAKAFLKINDAELLGIFSSDFERAKNFSQQYNIKAYKDFVELLNDPMVDIVDIVNIHSQHADFGIKAARAGKHIIVEKPLDISASKAKELIKECRKNNVYLSTIFQTRFDQTIKKLKKIIDSGKLGQIFLASAKLIVSRKQEYYDAGSGWRGKKELAGGGVLINQAMHTIDSLIYLFGEAASVYGQVETVNHNIQVEDTAVAVIRFKNNVLATLQATTSAFTRLPKIIEIHGSRGSAIISGDTLKVNPPINWLVNLASRFQNRLPYIFNISRKFKQGYHYDNLKAIISAIKNKSIKELPAGFEQGLKSLEIVEAIYKASQTQELVNLKSSCQKSFSGDYFQKYLNEAKDKKPRILLINPLNTNLFNIKFSHIGRHRLRQPLGLAYVSSFLKKITSTQLIDAAILGWNTQKTIEYIKSVNPVPMVIIISSSPLDRWQNPDLDISNIFEIINQTKIKIPQGILIGAHGTVTPDWVFKNCQINFIVRGEPELTCFELVKNLLESPAAEFSQIAGLSYRQNDQIIHNPDREFDNDPKLNLGNVLDNYPFPDYQSLPMHLYHYTTADLPTPFSLMLTSRGCPGQCIFCLKKMMPDRYRVRSAKNIYQEIKYLVNNFCIKSIYFQDWEFLIDKQRIKELCQLLINDPGLEIIWGCSARATSLDTGIIDLMKKAGCVLINFGYESGSPEILKLNRKGVDLEKTKKVIQFCHEQNINLRSFCLANLPGENKKTLRESAEFIVKNNLNVPHINIPIPYPGTPLAEKVNCNSWQDALKFAGKIDVQMEPETARRILKKYIWQTKFGKFYFLNPRFCLHILRILKRKLH